MSGAAVLPPPQPPPTVCCIVSRPLRTTVTPAPPLHFQRPLLLVCYYKMLFRLPWTPRRPCQDRHCSSSYLWARHTQGSPDHTTGQGDHLHFQDAGRGLCPRLVPGRHGEQRSKGTEASHRKHTHHSKKLLIVYLELKLDWVSCTFPGSPTPEGSFVTALVKHVNPEMRELLPGELWRSPVKGPDI